ncbi:MAG: SRPBCC family protein [Devosia sp.]
MSDTELRTVVVERDIPYPAEKIWRALTQPHLMAEWLMRNDFAPKVGHKFDFSTDWGGVLNCEVLEVEPHSSLSYTWNFDHDDPDYGLKSVVTFTLSPSARGTLLRVEQAGFRPGQKAAFGGAHAGWKEFLGKLEGVLGRVE